MQIRERRQLRPFRCSVLAAVPITTACAPGTASSMPRLALEPAVTLIVICAIVWLGAHSAECTTGLLVHIRSGEQCNEIGNIAGQLMIVQACSMHVSASRI